MRGMDARICVRASCGSHRIGFVRKEREFDGDGNAAYGYSGFEVEFLICLD